ncbi:MAG TPA: hypothetical protein VJY31_03205 [Buttiauxella sp.]|nr:hypothetical protein [Buttiauxella sp.]
MMDDALLISARETREGPIPGLPCNQEQDLLAMTHTVLRRSIDVERVLL